MRLALALVLVLVTLLTVVSSAAGKAALQVTAGSPFTVHGVGFAPGERVTLVAQIRGRHAKVVTATDAGTFTVRFDVSLGPCPAYIVRAIGNLGSRAYLRTIPECAQPGQAP